MVYPDGHRLTAGACIVISSPWGSPYPPCQIPKLPAASSDFMLQVTPEEAETLRLQIATSNRRWGGRRYLPHAFTKQGVAMLSGVLHSRRAVRVNVEIMRTFVKLRQILSSHAELARKLEELERRYEGQFRIVFDAIRELMAPESPESRPVGFRP